MTPLRRRIQIRLAVITGLMTAAAVVTTLAESRGAAEALLWGLGAGAVTAAGFALWYQVRENRPKDD